MNGPLKSHGGKHYLARHIVALMPPHLHFVEPYFGGGAVLFAKQHEGISEVVNDINGDLMNFWRVLQDKKAFTEFKRRMEATAFSEVEWQEAKTELAQEVGTSRKASIERAVSFFILARQSMAGRCADFAPISKNRTRRGMNEQASAWMQCVDSLPVVHARLRRVVILNRPALEAIRAHDTVNTTFYLDPPYLPETRSVQGVFGPFDMTAEQHEELLATIKGLQGKVLLSGYPSELYDKGLKGWHRHEFDLPNNAAGDIAKRRMTECVWCNFKAKVQHKEAG